jgi:septum formation protein
VAERPAPRIVLASSSPRRRDLLDQIGLDFDVRPADIDESERPGEDPVSYVRRLAVEKAQAATAVFDEIVIAADTTIDLDGRILAKPDDDDDARRMLRLLSGRTHRVHTGVAVRQGERIEVAVATTFVTMVAITDEAMRWYVATGEPLGKAGAYAIQGAAAVLVDSVQGSVSNVIGLPLTLLDQLLTRHGHPLASLV